MNGTASGAIRAVLAATIGLATMFASPALAEPWPIKRFEVLAVRPMADLQRSDTATENRGLIGVPLYRADLVRRFMRDRMGIDTERYDFAEVELSPTTKLAMESFLSDTAALYERWGFAPPNLQPVVRDRDGKQAYRVYLVEAQDDNGVHLSSCTTDRERVIIYGANHLLDGNMLKAEALATLAHELFHAVQFGSNFFACQNGKVRIGNWITEGQARAVGEDAVRTLRNGAAKMSGKRPYDQSLPVPAGREPGEKEYGTSSFWRFLAELKASGHAGPAPAAGDYSYLAGLLASMPAERDCATSAAKCKGEVAWLDRQLRQHIGRSLREAYGQFIAVYANYGPPRAGESDEKWRTETLASMGDCKPVDLKRQAGAVENVPVPIFLPLAATCFLVKPTGFSGPVHVRVRAEDTGMGLRLGDLNAAKAIGPFETKLPKLDTVGVGDDRSASWEFDFEPGKQTPFFLTNVATEAGQTAAMDGLKVSFTVLTEYAKVTTRGAGKSFEIGASVPITMGRFMLHDVIRATLDQHQKLGWKQACGLRVSAINASTGDIIEIAMDTREAVRAGTYPVANYGKVKPELYPGQVLVGYRQGRNGVPPGETPLTYRGEGGSLELTSFSPDFVSGTLSFNARRGDPGYGKRSSSPAAMSATFEFGFSPRHQPPRGKFAPMDYCFMQ